MPSSWNNSGYQLRSYWPVFKNKHLENRYQIERFGYDAIAVARGMFVLSFFYLLFLVPDQFVEFVSQEAELFNGIIKLVISIWGFMTYQYLMRHLTRAEVKKCVMIFQVVFCLCLYASFSIYALWIADPASLLEISICFAFLTILVYIFVPLNIFQQVACVTTLFFTFLLTVITLYSFSDSRFGYSLTFMFLANTFGLSISYTINKNLRNAWAHEKQKERDNILLKQEIKQRERLEQQLKKLAMTDALTGIDNRRSFMEHLGREKKRSDRQFTPLSIITFDIDLFKHINDQFGHEVGDTVLVNISRLVEERLRETDIFARIGGEEFAILIPDSSKKEAINLAESLRKAMSLHAILFEEKAIKVTASFGIAQYETNEPVDILLRRADKAMYQAKSAGRNCVSDKSD